MISHFKKWSRVGFHLKHIESSGSRIRTRQGFAKQADLLAFLLAVYEDHKDIFLKFSYLCYLFDSLLRTN